MNAPHALSSSLFLPLTYTPLPLLPLCFYFTSCLFECGCLWCCFYCLSVCLWGTLIAFNLTAAAAAAAIACESVFNPLSAFLSPATPSSLRRTHLMWQSTLKLCILVASYGIFISLAAQLCFSNCVFVCVLCCVCLCCAVCVVAKLMPKMIFNCVQHTLERGQSRLQHNFINLCGWLWVATD